MTQHTVEVTIDTQHLVDEDLEWLAQVLRMAADGVLEVKRKSGHGEVKLVIRDGSAQVVTSTSELVGKNKGR